MSLAAAVGLCACSSAPPLPSRPHADSASSMAAPTAAPPPAPESVPDATPRIEPRARNGNPPFYEVFGKRYFVMSSSSGYVERGVASWYGPGFHKVQTSIGEPYDMYGMTAAHRTLPLPAYVRVTNLQNGRSVVVRVNDRGPFVGNRIIDLSYTAAAKLDMLRSGTAMVEVRSIDPGTAPRPAAVQVAAATAAPAAPAAPAATAASALAAVASALVPAAQADVPVAGGAAPASAAPASAALFVQAGAFSDPANARRLAEKLRGGGYGNVFVRDDQIAGRRLYRVRIGPVPDVAQFDQIVAALEHAGIDDAHLALD
jgi:rare lipoprotein A